ncbi:hypothetical protein KY329_00955 [Candidatus Woesearchaeota archaeon]|nr:hypothetical protein [Candidatus Woesearchaeota archaeon]
MIFQAGIHLQTAVGEMQRWGLWDAILPFLLFFAILFAILQQVKIFKKPDGKADRKLNGVLAFVMSAMIVVPHIIGTYPATKDPVLIMYKILPTSTIIIIALVLVALLVGLTEYEVPAPIMLLAALAAIGTVVYLFVINIFPDVSVSGLGPLSDPKLQALLIVLLIFGLIVWFVVREKKEPEEGAYPYRWARELFGFEGKAPKKEG